ncbi:MAG: S-layer homology domain-containing protein [Synergistaceae bacterium]|nr:S-layer homology domain-containing protein [Synergistaceae bacterium]
MRSKIITIIISLLMAACAVSPVFAASEKNPFMDVPEGSWVYDAISRLASAGIISGYPDGLYKGKQSMTRYEAASVIARAMTYFDSRKAGAQDAETLKKLTAEFKDELDALGVKFDSVEGDASLFTERLGGWRFSGSIRMDAELRDTENIGVTGSGNMGYTGIGEGIFNVERWYGNKNESYFLSQHRVSYSSKEDAQVPSLDEMYYFYTRIPIYFGAFLTVGKAGAEDLDARFAYITPGMGRYSTWGWFDGAPQPMIKIDVNFVILNFTTYIAHGNVDGAGGTKYDSGIWKPYSPEAWNIFANLDVKLNQDFGFGLGAQYLIHDDWNVADSTMTGQGKAWDNIFTSWFGLDYNLSDGAVLHGIVYYQRAVTDDNFWGSGSVADRPDGGIAWRAALDINQSVLKFTSFYAEYMRAPGGFFALDGIDSNILLGDAEYEPVSFFGNVTNHDISMWKVGANQKWNDKFSSWLYYADITGSAADGYSLLDAGLRQYGGGFEYAYRSDVIFGLNYLKWEGKDAWSDRSYSRVRFTTHVSF